MLNRLPIYPIIALASLALLGLLLLQSHWLLQAFHRNQTVFQRQVETALRQVAEFIDPGDALFVRLETLTNPQHPNFTQNAAYAAETLRQVREKLDTVLPDTTRMQPYTLTLYRAEPGGLFYTDAASDGSHEPSYQVPLYRVCRACKLHLGVTFPQLSLVYFARPIVPLLLLSFLFVVTVLGCFAYTLKALHRLGKRSARQMAFVNNMTHEYKTPLFTISVAARMLKQSDALQQQAALLQQVQAIERANDRLKKHTERILDLAHLEAGTPALRKEETNLHALIGEAVTIFRPLIEQEGGALTTDCQAQNPTFYADSEQIACVLHNLVDNARKYTRGAPRVTIRTADVAHGLLLAVEDRGIGIEKSHHRLIFEKFYRVSTGDRHDVKGFGLGLSFVKETVRLHGGHITVKSHPNSGSCFTLIFPHLTP